MRPEGYNTRLADGQRVGAGVALEPRGERRTLFL